jgi:transposase
MEVLREVAASRTEPACEIPRAQYALAALEGQPLSSVLHQSGLKMRELKIRLDWMKTCLAELDNAELDSKKIRAIIHKALRDKPRIGAPAKITAAQVADIVKIACEQPKTYGLPFSRWNIKLLRETVIAQKVLADISVSNIGKILRRADIKPHRSKYWLTSADRGTPEFEPRCHEVIKLYGQAEELVKQGINVVSCDEKTGTQALERISPDKPTAPGQPAKLEYHSHPTALRRFA